jgi:hypothetical protein
MQVHDIEPLLRGDKSDCIVIEPAGSPKGKGRLRFSRRSGTAYTPAETRSYESRLKYAGQIAMDGRASAAEVFQTYNKAGTGADAALKDSAVVCSLALQFGVPLDTFRHALLRNGRGVASSPLGCALDILADAGR